MRLPVLRGMIDRRILVNFRVEGEVLARILPPPFRPQLIEGKGMAGICLIRLAGIGPRWLPSVVGIGSENAAHRIAVEWDDHGATRTGVYCALLMRHIAHEWHGVETLTCREAAKI